MGYVEIDEKLIGEVEDLTYTSYENKGGFLPLDSVEVMVENLVGIIHVLEEKIDDLKEKKEQDVDGLVEDMFLGV